MNLGNGFWLTLNPADPTKGWLTTPQRQVLPWREGQDLPIGVNLGGPGASPAPSATALPGAPAAGGSPYPAIGGTDDRVKLLEDSLRAERERAREEEHRRDVAAMEAKFERLLDAQNKRHEELLRELSAKKADPEAEALKEQNRRMEVQLAEERREREAQRREDQIRQEMQQNNARVEKLITELSQNRGPDPMITMLTGLMQSMQQSAQAQLQAMENQSRSQSEASREQLKLMADRAERDTRQTLEFIRMAKDRGPEEALHKQMSEAMQTVFGMMQNVVQMQSELSPGEPAWMSALRQGMDQIGSMGASYFQQKARSDERREQEERARRAALQHRRALAAAQQEAQQDDQQQSGPAPMPAPRPPQRRARPLTPDEIRERAAAEAFPEAPMMAAEDEGPIDVEEAAGVDDGGIALPEGVTPEQAAAYWRQQPTERIREHISSESDEDLFTIILPKVEELRHAVAQQQMAPEETADTILQAVVALRGFGQLDQVPAMELLTGGHVQVLMERLLPEAPEMYVAQCVSILTEAIERAGEAA